MFKKIVFFLIFFLLVFSNFSFYITADYPPGVGSPFLYFYPPENSFGISRWTTVNWSYFDFYNCFSYETNADDLEVEWNKTDDNSKFKYKFKTDVYGLYYLNISFIDNNIENVLYIGNFTFELVYSGGSMFFNFTDIIVSTDFEYEYILNVDGFKLILFSYLDVGEWEIDPNFGCETGFSTDIAFATDNGFGTKEEFVRCYNISVTGGNYCVDYVWAYLDYSGTGTVSCKAVIYTADGGSEDVITNGISVEREIPYTASNTWFRFNYSSRPTVENGKYYYVGIIADADDIPSVAVPHDVEIGYQNNASHDHMYSQNLYSMYPNPPDPISSYSTYARRLSIYMVTSSCVTGCVDECLINETSEYPVNGTTGILTDFVNSSVFVSASCGLIDWVNISVNGVGFQNFTSPANGTFWYNNTDVYCKNSYIWWCNTSCNGSLNSSWFSYTVDLNCCPFVNNSVPANGSSGVSTSTQYWYVDSYDQNNEKTDGTIECTNGDSGSWSQKLNGTRSLKFDSGLDGGENYTVWVNITDGECSNNYTFWFETAGWYNRCPDLDQIPIANESEGVYIDIDWWNMTVYDPDGNTTNGTIWIYSVENPSYYTNMSWFNQANGTQSLDLRNYTFSYDTNYTVNITITDGQCVRNRTYWFITQNAPFGNITWDAIEEWLQENGYIKLENDTMEIELTSSFLGVFITLVLFILFFIVGYTENKRSGGAFFMLSGFLLLSLEYLVATSLDNISIALLSPFAIFIIVLGIRKWLYPAGKEKTKTEGQ